MELEIGEPLAALCVEPAYTQQAKEADCLNGLRCGRSCLFGSQPLCHTSARTMTLTEAMSGAHLQQSSLGLVALDRGQYKCDLDPNAAERCHSSLWLNCLADATILCMNKHAFWQKHQVYCS
jgi:hypothetical protein